MKHLFISLLFLTVGTVCSCQSQSSDSYNDQINKERKEKNKKFLNSEKSPLTKADQKNFLGLSYYAVDAAYKIKARFVPFTNDSTFTMATTTERQPIYDVLGIAHFTIRDTACSLTVFRSAADSLLFIPFNDYTNGKSTYGGGRYIDQPVKSLNSANDSIRIDFNLAYNPYCAYNYKFSCPIPPESNKLPVAIKAGEKNFK